MNWLDVPFWFPVFGSGENLAGAVPVRRRHCIALGAILAAIEGGGSVPLALQVYLSAEERAGLLDLAVQAAAEDEGVGQFLEDTCLDLRAGMPGVPFTTVAAEARWWVEWASEAERKQYLLACFRSLSREERVRFLAAAQRLVLA
ncbi:MAG: hypothetical protein QM699_07620 [Amaricoccus sp.]|uniref:hypothetical protein n=1 Tax=Amaricoccus sp. TaxID=1872485 RepID=UPI0039E25394